MQLTLIMLICATAQDAFYRDMVHFILLMMLLPGPPTRAGISDNTGFIDYLHFISRSSIKIAFRMLPSPFLAHMANCGKLQVKPEFFIQNLGKEYVSITINICPWQDPMHLGTKVKGTSCDTPVCR